MVKHAHAHHAHHAHHFTQDGDGVYRCLVDQCFLELHNDHADDGLVNWTAILTYTGAVVVSLVAWRYGGAMAIRGLKWLAHDIWGNLVWMWEAAEDDRLGQARWGGLTAIGMCLYWCGVGAVRKIQRMTNKDEQNESENGWWNQ